MGRHVIVSFVCFVLVCSLSQNSLSASTSSRQKRSRSISSSLPTKPGRSDGGSGPGTCRCVPDQWEAVMRSVERDIDLQAAVASMFPSSGTEFRGDSTSAENHDSEDVDMVEMMGIPGSQGREQRGPEVEPSSGAADFTVSEESTTSIYYDYTGRRLALIESHQRSGSVRRTRTISDHKAGVRYVINSDDECRTHAVRENMNRMCLPDGVTLAGKFNLGIDSPVSLWTATGPNNSTLRTAVDRRRCVPVYEETFSVEPDYMSLKTTFYTNVRLGIKDWSVFTIPSTCQVDGAENDPTSDAKRRS